MLRLWQSTCDVVYHNLIQMLEKYHKYSSEAVRGQGGVNLRNNECFWIRLFYSIETVAVFTKMAEPSQVNTATGLTHLSLSLLQTGSKSSAR